MGPTVGGSPTFLAAHGIARTGAMPFEVAFGLCRLVIDRAGGPVEFAGKAAYVDRKVVKALEGAGHVEIVHVDRGTYPVYDRPQAAPNLRPLLPAQAREQSLMGGRTARVAVVTQQGFDLVGAHVEGGIGWLEHAFEDDISPHALEDDSEREEEAEPSLSLDPSVVWCDLEPLMNELFCVWTYGSDRAWATFAWQTLSAGGLTVGRGNPERTVIVGRALALAATYLEFCAYAFDESAPGEWQESVPADGSEWADEFNLGRLCERRGWDLGSADDGRPRTPDAVRCLVRDEAPVIVDALVKALGQAELFASMWRSNSSSTRFPLTADEISGVVNAPTDDMLRAWEWFDSGLPL